MRAGCLLLLLAALTLAGCGGGGDEAGGAPSAAEGLAVPWVDPDGEPPYIGSLAVDPSDDRTLLMGTNTGLFRVPPGGEPEKVTGTLRTPDGAGRVSESLVAAYVGEDALLGSGHPAEGQALPPVLGLIRSEDEGRTWTSVSELGRADFHALERSKDQLVGALYGQAQVLVSGDEGRTWETRSAPMPLTDLEVDPEDPRRWIGTTERGIFLSTDGGGSWRQRDPTPNVRLAWAEDGQLYRIDPGGPVLVSRDGGERWEERGSSGGEPQALAVGGDGTIYAALFDGTIRASQDGGATFSTRVRGAG
jgi:photosystem II stability/assembly factor-like uncharacterized protein